jgi:MFS family permease
MSDPFLTYSRLAMLIFPPLMLAFPWVFAILVPNRVTENSGRIQVRGQMQVLALSTMTLLAIWLGLVLASLIIGAVVCNVNLSVANIALPDIARSLGASQTTVNLVAIGTTLGLAMSVLWFGALGDRYGRKGMLLAGLFLTVPFSLLATFAPTAEVLVSARIATGLAAGMSYPTTLALITALWGDGPARTRSIALW